MLQSVFRRLSLGAILAIVLAVALLSWPSVEKTGDRLQIALPVLGLACAAANGRGLIYVGRYIVLETAIKTPKFALGDLPLNRRPNGALQGFPSGHTAAATFGAVGLSQTCLRENRPAQAVALLAAGYTGGSRIEAGAHSTVQVIGHTDNTGDAGYNQGLSERRANAVADVLMNGGVAFGRIQTFGRGEDQPVASNLSEEGRAQNRRVEIVILPTA